MRFFCRSERNKQIDLLCVATLNMSTAITREYREKERILTYYYATVLNQPRDHIVGSGHFCPERYKEVYRFNDCGDPQSWLLIRQ